MILSKANHTTQRVFQIKSDDTTASKLKVMISSSASDTTNYCTTPTSTLTTNSWQHYSIVYDGTLSTGDDQRIKVYKNGKLVTCTVNGTIPVTLVPSTTSLLKLGQGDDSTPTTFIGFMDEFKLYNSALTQDQILIDYNLGAAINFNTGASIEASQSADTADRAPVGYWNFNENTGQTAKDISGNNYNLTLTNFTASPSWKPGKIGSSILLDGADNTVRYAATGNELYMSSSFSLSLWINFQNTISNQNDNAVLIDKNACNNSCGTENYQIYITGSNIRCEFENESGPVYPSVDSTGFTPELGKWYNIGCVFDDTANTMNIYINGIKNNTATVSISPGNIQTAGRFSVGNFYSVGSGFKGLIDEVKVYDYARSQSQVAYDFNRGAPSGWWKFDECSGSTLYDSSGNANHGTWSGSGGGSNTAVGTCTDGNSAHSWYNGVIGKFNSNLDFDGSDDRVDLETYRTQKTLVNYLGHFG